jgi:hypothetical protein
MKSGSMAVSSEKNVVFNRASTNDKKTGPDRAVKRCERAVRIRKVDAGGSQEEVAKLAFEFSSCNYAVQWFGTASLLNRCGDATALSGYSPIRR